MGNRCLGCMSELDEDAYFCPYCGYKTDETADSPLHMSPGTILDGRYLVGRVIGYGGFGVTYIGWDLNLQRKVAVKEYLPSEFATRSMGQNTVTVFGGDKREQFIGGMKKFVDEARRLAKFKDEEGIVQVYDSFEENYTAYIIMEYLDGETLSSYMERVGIIPAEEAIEMMTPVIRSLESVHGEGIIHRDIAPDNIMITKDGIAKLIDFGASRYATTTHSRSLTVIIKQGYSPEEQYRSKGDQGAYTDIYAIGAVLYRMITGITPPDALERRVSYENKKKDSLIPPSKYCEISKSQENAILNAMNVRIEDRPQTAAEFLEQLHSVTPVRRIAGKIKAIDLMKWPLWAKIVIPFSGMAAVLLLILLLTGRIGFINSLITSITLDEGMTRVPNVVNYSVDEAEKKLDDTTLSFVIAGRIMSDTIPENRVLRQGVDAGNIVEEGTEIALYISAAESSNLEEGVMPDVFYYTEDEAAQILEQLGAVVSVEYEYSDTVAEGIVIRTSPTAGEALKEEMSVVLYVSLGKNLNAEEAEEETAEEVLTLSSSTLRMSVGESSALTAKGGSGDYTWSSSNAAVASVNGTGTVTAIMAGTAVISVSAEANGERDTASCTVTVTEPVIVNIVLSSENLALEAGETATLTATVTPAGQSISWSSSDESVATVSAAEADGIGYVEAIQGGYAVITAAVTDNGTTYTSTCSVTVTETEAETNAGTRLSPSSLHLTVGEEAEITLEYYFDSNSISTSWETSNANVVWLSGFGSFSMMDEDSSFEMGSQSFFYPDTFVIKALKSGTATITATTTDGENHTYVSTCTVTVTEAQ